MITADGTREAVHEFAQRVRDALSDLPADEVDELTDGLEADLFERADELGGTDGFGDPVAYADELRVSAGLPERNPAKRSSASADARTAIVTGWRRGVAAVRRNSFGAWLIDVAVALRPVWWVIRGWTVWQVISVLFFHARFGLLPLKAGLLPDPVPALFLLALVLFSVQWGRGRWMPGRWARGFLVLVSVCTVIAVLPATAIAINNTTSSDAMSYAEATAANAAPPGLYSAGQQVFNIYAYDANGNPLQNVRLYDQDGRPLRTVPDIYNYPVIDGSTKDGTNFTITRSPLADGPLGWSVYPLPSAPKGAHELPPFRTVQPLNAEPSQPTATATATPTPSPALSATPTPTPTETPAG